MSDKQIFLYTAEAKLTSHALAELRKSGVIPIKVDNFDAVKLIDPLLVADRSVVFDAAIEAIATHGISNAGPKTLFGSLLSQKLFSKKIKP